MSNNDPSKRSEVMTQTNAAGTFTLMLPIFREFSETPVTSMWTSAPPDVVTSQMRAIAEADRADLRNATVDDSLIDRGVLYIDAQGAPRVAVVWVEPDGPSVFNVYNGHTGNPNVAKTHRRIST